MESETMVVPDFSELPDVFWVRVLRYLTLKDRSKVSKTCRLLNDVFNHPSLWYTQKLSFMGESHNFSRHRQTLVCAVNQLELTKRFGKYFQNLTIKIDGHLRDLPDDLKGVLEAVSENCRLETLTIDAGTITNQYQQRYGFPPENAAVKLLASFVQNAFRMRHLHIRSWPMFRAIDTEECNIFKVLVQNKKLRKSLETLTIYWLEEQEWSEREPILYSGHPASVIELFQTFRNLTTVGLRTPMLTKELLELLASPDRARLQLLKIVVHFLDRYQERREDNLFRIPSIPSATWQALVRRNPDFRVMCTIFLATPDIEIASMLTPEVPLSSLAYMKYSKLDPHTLARMSAHYAATLTKFHCFCDSYNMDQELLQMVEKWTNLTDFIYHGEIKSSTVVAIATARGESWKRLEVKEEKIIIPSPYDEVDENQVLAPGPDGHLVLVAMMKFHQSEEERSDVLQSLVKQVSAVIGASWRPLK